MIKISTLTIILIFILYDCSNEKANELVINYLNPVIEYSGRIDTSKNDGAELYWSGTSIKINFEGGSIHALLKDQSGDNYFNIIIDNDSIVVLRPDTTKQYYQLASNLSEGKHSIEIFKRTEWDRGKTNFYGFKINDNAKLLPKSPPKKRKIEFYGNSITSGYAVEDTSGKDSPDSIYTNNYLSYAAITARHFSADYQCICKGGIGITVSWFPLTMPEMYDRLIPEDPTSQWDFSLYTPDVVVINLMQNDSWIVNLPDNIEFKNRFGNTAPDEDFIIDRYQKFVTGIRNHYPNAKIICALGNMDATRAGSKWINYVERAVSNLNDPNIYTHFFPFKETAGHPSMAEQEKMGASLIQFMEENIEW